MGYGTNVCIVDLEQLRAAVGSRDLSVLKKIRRKYDADPDDYDYDFNEVDTALRELIEGELAPARADRASRYGEALLFLCRHLGAWVNTYDEIGGLDELEDACGCPLVTPGPPVPIPTSSSMPEINHLTHAQVSELLTRLEQVDTSGWEYDFVEALAEFRKCLKRAAGKGAGIVTFTC